MMIVAQDDRRPAQQGGPTEQPSGDTTERASTVAPDPDFAEEHASSSHADDQPGGPEGTPEPESPEGLAGMDP